MPFTRINSNTYRDNFLVFFIFYNLQGIPYSLQTRYLSLYFREHDMDLVNISLYRLTLLPWCLKTLWTPTSKLSGGNARSCLQTSLSLLVIMCIVISRCIPTGQALDLYFTTFLLMYNLLTSLMHISLDMLVTEIREKRLHYLFDHIRIVGNGTGALIVASLGWYGNNISWSGVFSVLAIAYLFGLFVSLNVLPEWAIVRARPRSRNERGRMRSSMAGETDHEGGVLQTHRASLTQNEGPSHLCLFGFASAFSIEGSLWTFLFLSFYEIGVQGLKNLYPLYLLDNGRNFSDVGFWTGFLAQFASLIGSFLGMIFVTRSLLRTLLKLTIVMVFLIGYLSFSIMFDQEYPTAYSVYSNLCFVAIFLISAAMTGCSLRMAVLISRRAPEPKQKQLLDLLVSADALGKILFATLLGTLTQWMGYVFVFGLFLAASLATIPLLLATSEAVALYILKKKISLTILYEYTSIIK